MKTKKIPLAIVTIALTITLLPGAAITAHAKDSNAGLIDIGGGSGDPLKKKEDRAKTCKDGKKCDVPVCNKATKGGDFGSIKNYYQAPFPLCSDGIVWSRSASIVKCLVGYDEFRMYGTKTDPVKFSTLSRTNIISWCAPDPWDRSRLYYPNPKDSNLGKSIQKNQVWAVATYKTKHRETLALSDNCTQNEAESLKPGCVVTSLAPRLSLDGDGKVSSNGCQDLAVKGENSVSSRLQSNKTPPKMALKLREAIFKHYQTVSTVPTKHKTALPAAISALPVDGLTAKRYLTATDITEMRPAFPCSSPLEYIPAFENKPVSDPVILGSCVTPIFLVGRIFRNSTEPQYLKNGDPNPDHTQYGFWGTWNEFYSYRYDNQPVRMMESGSVYDPIIGKPIDANSGLINKEYINAVKNLVRKDPGTVRPATNKLETVGGYYFPEDIKLTDGIEVLLSAKHAKQAESTLKDPTLRAESAAKATSCWATELSTSLVKCEIDDPVCVEPTPSPSPSPTPSETKSIPSPRPTFEEPKLPTGPVQVMVTVQAPGSYTVGGLSRTHTTKVTGVTVTCEGRPCGSRESDPIIEGEPKGELTLRPVGGYTNCASSREKECDQLITRESGKGNMNSRSVESVYYSPTRQTEAVQITVTNAELRVIPKKKETYVVCPPIDEETGRPSGPCETFTRWVPDPANAYTIKAFGLKFPDGKGSNRPVTGTIGK
ncbi:MAG: hypothetical protein ACKOW9_00540 [Candidatus Paceibacterota bacterium]